MGRRSLSGQGAVGLVLVVLAAGELSGCAAPPCQAQRDCAAGFYCDLEAGSAPGVCVQDCRDSSECGPGLLCGSLGRCVFPPEPPLRSSSAASAVGGWTNIYSSWTLQRGDADQLYDVDAPGSVYPNHLGCERLELAVLAGGNLCGGCMEGGGRKSFACGGPGRGIPYFVTAPRLGGAQAALVVIDIHGSVARAFGELRSVCVPLGLGRWRSCQVCADADGALDSSSCVAALGAPWPACTELEVAPGQMCTFCAQEEGGVSSPDCAAVLTAARQEKPIDAISFDELCTRFTVGSQHACEVCSTGAGITGGGCADDALDESCFLVGAEAFRAQLDQRLSALGLPDSGLSAQLVGSAEVAAYFGGFTGTCDALESPPAPISTGYLSASGLRCGPVGWDSLLATCALRQSLCGDDVGSFELGASTLKSLWDFFSWRPSDDARESLPDAVDEFAISEGLPPCDATASPLAVDVGEGLALDRAAHGPSFDLRGEGRQLRCGWLARGALLAMDLDLDGRIGSGAELFGEATAVPAGGRARHGFAALAMYDWIELGGNEDGRLDQSDLGFALLQLWTDRDRDGVSQPPELRYADQAGLRALLLDHWPVEVPPAWAADSDVLLRGLAEWSDGGVRDLYDVWLRFEPLPRPGS